jgi:hypothetical protein
MAMSFEPLLALTVILERAIDACYGVSAHERSRERM